MRRLKALNDDVISVVPEVRRSALQNWDVWLKATIARSFLDDEKRLEAWRKVPRSLACHAIILPEVPDSLLRVPCGTSGPRGARFGTYTSKEWARILGGNQHP